MSYRKPNVGRQNTKAKRRRGKTGVTVSSGKISNARKTSAAKKRRRNHRRRK